MKKWIVDHIIKPDPDPAPDPDPVIDLDKMLKTPFYVVSDTINTLSCTSVNGVKINWSLNEDLTEYHELPANTTTTVLMEPWKKVYLFCTEDQPAFFF